MRQKYLTFVWSGCVLKTIECLIKSLVEMPAFFQDFFKHGHIIYSIVGGVCLATKVQCKRFLCICSQARMLLFYYINRIAKSRPYRVKSIFQITGTQSPVHHFKIKTEPILSYYYDIIKFLQPVQKVIERGPYTHKINGVALVGKNSIAPINPRELYSIM